jgi:hypothetical protein
VKLTQYACPGKEKIMKAEILGISQRHSGTSKSSGKPYDFTTEWHFPTSKAYRMLAAFWRRLKALEIKGLRRICSS